MVEEPFSFSAKGSLNLLSSNVFFQEGTVLLVLHSYFYCGHKLLTDSSTSIFVKEMDRNRDSTNLKARVTVNLL